MASHLVKHLALFFFFFLVLSSVEVAVLQAAAPWAPCDFPAIINLGDSNSDTGGLSATFGPVPPPYGETFFGMPAGRYSDGRLIIDFMANSLGLPYISAYLDSIGTNFSHGANFATATATIRRPNSTLFQGGYSPFSLDVQSSQFTQFKSRSQIARSQGGVFENLMPKEDYFSRALYMFDIGQNDITLSYDSGKTTAGVIADVPQIIDELAVVIKGIYEQGGRYFWIHNTGPLGCLPYILYGVNDTAAQFDGAGCATSFNKVAQAFNQRLKEVVAQLRKDLPLAALTYVDVYSAKYKLISRGRKYGFEQPLLSCCGYGGGRYNFERGVRCGDTGMVNGTRVLLGKSCENPSQRIVWDGVHYTEAANRWVFDQISGGALSDPPLPLRMACRRHPQ